MELPYSWNTEPGIKACMWLREISSCSCLTVLPERAWLLLNKICIPLFRALYNMSRTYSSVPSYIVQEFRFLLLSKAEYVVLEDALCRVILSLPLILPLWNFCPQCHGHWRRWRWKTLSQLWQRRRICFKVIQAVRNIFMCSGWFTVSHFGNITHFSTLDRAIAVEPTGTQQDLQSF